MDCEFFTDYQEALIFLKQNPKGKIYPGEDWETEKQGYFWEGEYSDPAYYWFVDYVENSRSFIGTDVTLEQAKLYKGPKHHRVWVEGELQFAICDLFSPSTTLNNAAMVLGVLKEIEFAGYSDWQIPTKSQIASIQNLSSGVFWYSDDYLTDLKSITSEGYQGSCFDIETKKHSTIQYLDSKKDWSGDSIFPNFSGGGPTGKASIVLVRSLRSADCN